MVKKTRKMAKAVRLLTLAYLANIIVFFTAALPNMAASNPSTPLTEIVQEDRLKTEQKVSAQTIDFSMLKGEIKRGETKPSILKETDPTFKDKCISPDGKQNTEETKYYHLYSLSGQAKEKVIISVMGSGNFAPEVHLYSPEKKLLAAKYLPKKGLKYSTDQEKTTSILANLPQNGTYYILVSSTRIWQSSKVGNYTLKVNQDSQNYILDEFGGKGSDVWLTQEKKEGNVFELGKLPNINNQFIYVSLDSLFSNFTPDITEDLKRPTVVLVDSTGMAINFDLKKSSSGDRRIVKAYSPKGSGVDYYAMILGYIPEIGGPYRLTVWTDR